MTNDLDLKVAQVGRKKHKISDQYLQTCINLIHQHDESQSNVL